MLRVKTCKACRCSIVLQRAWGKNDFGRQVIITCIRCTSHTYHPQCNMPAGCVVEKMTANGRSFRNMVRTVLRQYGGEPAGEITVAGLAFFERLTAVFIFIVVRQLYPVAPAFSACQQRLTDLRAASFAYAAGL